MNQPHKPTLAMYWAAGCGGCEIAVLNTNERILDIDANFDILFWPVAMDAKYKDVAGFADQSIDVCLFNGGIRSSENEEMAHLLRQKSRLLVAFGSCACEGCIPGMANLYPVEKLYETAYTTLTTDKQANGKPKPEVDMPEGRLHLPLIKNTLQTLDQVVTVDYYVPGCPPESAQISAVIDALIAVFKGESPPPPPRSVLGAGSLTVCDECKRSRSEKQIGEFRRMATYQPNPNDCLLEQGILCSGVATRSGCNARCPTANMPCIGCYGPAQLGWDHGARLMSAIASVIDGDSPQEINRVLDGIPDPAGTFYRFGLAHSYMRRARPIKEHTDDQDND